LTMVSALMASWWLTTGARRPPTAAARAIVTPMAARPK
jgi:hypothetical protein